MKDDSVYLRHILDSIARIQAYTNRGRDIFFQETLIQDAVLRNLEIIGEAVKRLSASAKQQAPNIPWAQIAGMRDVLIHNYFGVKLDRVWQVVERDLPALDSACPRFCLPHFNCK